MSKRELAPTTCFDKMARSGKARATLLPDSDDSEKAKARVKFGECDTINSPMPEEAAQKRSGGKALGTMNHSALIGDLRQWDCTVAAIAEDLKRPGIIHAVLMPHGNRDTKRPGAFVKGDPLVSLLKGNAAIIRDCATTSRVERHGTRKAKPPTGGGAPAPSPVG